MRAFESKKIGDYVLARTGMKTGNNKVYIRLWWESVDVDICFYAKNHIIAIESNKKWYPYNKGGEYRKWYGNNDFVVDWENDGFRIKNFKDPKTGKLRSRPQNLGYMLKEGLTYTNVSSSKLSVRYCKSGFIFDATGSMIFVPKERLNYLLAYLLSKVADRYAAILSASMTFEVGQIASLPVIYSEPENRNINLIVEDNICKEKDDWDAFETSWDFKKHPLV